MNAEERANQVIEQLDYEVGMLLEGEKPHDFDTQQGLMRQRIAEAIREAENEAIEKPLKQLRRCADWLMSAQGYLMAGIRDQLKECEDETRALIKQLKQT